MSTQRTTSTARRLFAPTQREHRVLGEGPKIAPYANKPYFQLVYPVITGGNNGENGFIITLTLNESGTECIEADIVHCHYRPSFLAVTEKGSLVVAAEKAIWLHGGKQLISLESESKHWITNDGCPISPTTAIIGTKSTQDPKVQDAPVFYVNFARGFAEQLPLLTKIGNGCFVYGDRFFHTDTPTQQLRSFPFLEIGRMQKVIIDFATSDWPDGWPDGIVGPFEGEGEFEGRAFCAIALWNSVASTGSVVVVDIATGEVVHEILVPGAGQVTCIVVHNGFVYITTATEGYNEEQLAANPNGGCVFIVEAPPMLSNPPAVPLLAIE